jgi:2-methylisocitrate lyase-like PEP mutase family enzyme
MNGRETPSERARRFQELHLGPGILILPNAWDAASARIYEEAGFVAVGTTSAGIANALGYPDGQRLPFAEMAAAVRRISETLRVPVSADIEAGFGETPEAVADNCRAILAAGAVGINLEDGTGQAARPLADLSLHSEKVRAVREVARESGVALVINARTDVFLDSVGAPETRLSEALRRANAYRSAGADCLFVPGVTDAETIGQLVRGIQGPINVLAAPRSPPIAALERLGVARVSLGSAPMRAGLALLRRLARELHETGTYQTLADAIPYAEVNRLFQPVE